MKLLVISMCSKEKARTAPQLLTIGDFAQGPDHVAQREPALQELMLPAAEFYLGKQHQRLMSGINRILQIPTSGIELDHWILSAGYGLIRSQHLVAPYDCTFCGMSKPELRHWAEHLHVPTDASRVLGGKYDFGLVLLAKEYLEACQLSEDGAYGGKLLFLCCQTVARKLPQTEQVRAMALTNVESAKFRCSSVIIKGELANRILDGVLAKPALVSEYPSSNSWQTFFRTGRFS